MANSKKGQIFFRPDFQQIIVLASDPFTFQGRCAKSDGKAYKAFVFEGEHIMTGDRYWRESEHFCDFEPVGYPVDKHIEDPFVPILQYPFGQQKLREAIMHVFQNTKGRSKQ